MSQRCITCGSLTNSEHNKYCSQVCFIKDKSTRKCTICNNRTRSLAPGFDQHMMQTCSDPVCMSKRTRNVEQNLKAMQSERDNLRRENDDLTHRLRRSEGIDDEYNALKRQNESLERRRETLKDELSSVKDKYETVKEKYADLREKHNDTREQLEDVKRELFLVRVASGVKSDHQSKRPRVDSPPPRYPPLYFPP